MIRPPDRSPAMYGLALAPAIVPDRQLPLVLQCTARIQNKAQHLAGHFPAGVEQHLAWRCFQRMPGQDDELEAAPPTLFLECLA